LIKIVALDVEESIPAGAIIFERDLCPELHQLFFGKLIAQARVQLIGDIRQRIGERVGKFNDQSFRVIEWRHVVATNSMQLFIAQAGFSAHGRIDVYSERTADACCGADSPQLHIAQ
jgi:hypothetical protein